MDESIQNNVGEGISVANAAWTFEAIASKFDEHVSKSVPLYGEGHDLVVKLSDFFIHENSICYDLGCSTGTLTNGLMARHQNKESAQFIGIDVEESMIEKAKSGEEGLARFFCGDILHYPFEMADLFVAYYTIQFVAPRFRQELIQKIYESLNWGGAFIYFEKVRAPDARFQDYMSSLYLDHKLEQGYSPDEIVSKSRSLKRVLEPFSTQGNYDLLKRAGFKDVMTIMKHTCFEGILAIK